MAEVMTERAGGLEVERQRENVEPDDPERELETPEDTPAEEEDAAAQADGALFDKSEYEREDLQLPKVDGEPTDKIAVKFAGTVMLDRTDPADVALMRSMRLGGDVTLMVEAKVAGKGHAFTTNREGDLDAVVLQNAVRVHTVYRPAAT